MKKAKTGRTHHRGRAPARRPATSDPGPALFELRTAIGNLRAAAEALDAAGALPTPEQAALLAAVLDESARASHVIDELARREAPAGAQSTARRAALLAADIVRRAGAEQALALSYAGVGDADGRVAVPPRLTGAIVATLGRLRTELRVGEADLTLRRHDTFLSLEVAFVVRESAHTHLEDLPSTLLAPTGGNDALVEAARTAGGEAWLSIRRGEPKVSLRLLLPFADAAKDFSS